MTASNIPTDHVNGTKRWSHALILLVVLGPMTAAYLIYKTGVGIPTGTINKGVILQPPLQLDQMPLRDAAGASFRFGDQPKKWRLLIPVTGHCGEQCRDNLYLTRQVHTRLNEKYTRVERYVVSLSPSLEPDAQALLKQQYPQVKVVYADAQQWQQQLSATNFEQGEYLLVDQENFAMMFYRAEHSGNDLLADLKRMLKFSREP